MVLENNMFIEVNLTRGLIGELAESDHDVYRAPFLEPASRKPMLAWPREFPLDGEPADVVEVVRATTAGWPRRPRCRSCSWRWTTGVGTGVAGDHRLGGGDLRGGRSRVGRAGRPSRPRGPARRDRHRHRALAAPARADRAVGSSVVSMEADEAGLVARAVDGDKAALEEVIRLLQDPLYRLALRMVWRPADAEDATQEILIRVVTRLASWRGEARLLTWAYRIGVNYLLNLRRQTPQEAQQVSLDEFARPSPTGWPTPTTGDPRPPCSPRRCGCPAPRRCCSAWSAASGSRSCSATSSSSRPPRRRGSSTSPRPRTASGWSGPGTASARSWTPPAAWSTRTRSAAAPGGCRKRSPSAGSTRAAGPHRAPGQPVRPQRGRGRRPAAPPARRRRRDAGAPGLRRAPGQGRRDSGPAPIRAVSAAGIGRNDQGSVGIQAVQKPWWTAAAASCRCGPRLRPQATLPGTPTAGELEDELAAGSDQDRQLVLSQRVDHTGICSSRWLRSTWRMARCWCTGWPW